MDNNKEIYFQEVLKSKLLPAITFADASHALPVAEALLKAGLKVMEVPFRTNEAEKAITAIRNNFPEMKVGAGTLLKPEQIRQAIDAGAEFGLSPGFNPSVGRAALDHDFPFIPGVMTPSEIELSYEMGYSVLKLFPAGQVGGISFLNAMKGPYAQLNLKFIPMGGVNPGNIREYTGLKNVIAVGGSWLATEKLMSEKNYEQIYQHVKEALELIG